ncbi:hypothetical protein CAZ33_34325, partial [Pseudomonas aeruginosa]
MSKQANGLILPNSPDGSSSYQMMAGKFRFVCANGLVLGDMAMDQKVRHSGRIDVVNDVIEGAYEVLGQFEQIDANLDDMQHYHLRQDEQEAFAIAPLSYRSAPSAGPAPVPPPPLLLHRRADDPNRDLWTTYS